MVKQGKPKTREEAREKIEAIKKTYFKGSTGTSVSKGGQTYAVGTGGGSAPVPSGGTPATSGGKAIIQEGQVVTQEEIAKQRQERARIIEEEERRKEEIARINVTLQRQASEETARRGKRGEIIVEGEERKYTEASPVRYAETPKEAVVRTEFLPKTSKIALVKERTVLINPAVTSIGVVEDVPGVRTKVKKISELNPYEQRQVYYREIGISPTSPTLIELRTYYKPKPKPSKFETFQKKVASATTERIFQSYESVVEYKIKKEETGLRAFELKYFPEFLVGEKLTEQNVSEGYMAGLRKGAYTSLREKPVTMAGAFALSSFGAPAISGIKYGAVRLVGAVPVLKVLTPTAKYLGKGLTYTLVVAYGFGVGKRILSEPTPFGKGEATGIILTSEVAPFIGGTSLGKRFAYPIEYKIGVEKGLQQFPEKRAEFIALKKELAKIKRGEIPPKKLPVGSLESGTPKARAIAKKFLIMNKEKVVVGGSLSARAQLSSTKGLRKPGDIDVYVGETKAEGKVLAKSLTKMLQEGGVSASRHGVKVYVTNLAGKSEKFAEFHSIISKTKFSLFQNIRTVKSPLTPYKGAVVRTPEGIKLFRLRYQMARKLYGGFEVSPTKTGGYVMSRYSKDIPDYKAVVKVVGGKSVSAEPVFRGLPLRKANLGDVIAGTPLTRSAISGSKKNLELHHIVKGAKKQGIVVTRSEHIAVHKAMGQLGESVGKETLYYRLLRERPKLESDFVKTLTSKKPQLVKEAEIIISGKSTTPKSFIPRLGKKGAVFFHGTSEQNVPSILKEGLKPHSVGWLKKPAVFLSKDIETARYFGGEKGAVIKVNLKDNLLQYADVGKQETIFFRQIPPQALNIQEYSSPKGGRLPAVSGGRSGGGSYPFIKETYPVLLLQKEKAPQYTIPTKKVSYVTTPYKATTPTSQKIMYKTPPVKTPTYKTPSTPYKPPVGPPPSTPYKPPVGPPPSTPYKPPVRSPPFVPPPTTPPPKTIFRTKTKKEPQVYRVEVRKEGIFEEVAEESNLQLAVTKGIQRVRETASASFRITNRQGLIGRIAGLVPAGEFYRSRKEPGVIIQRRERRISTPGEKKEITFKGIASLRGRRSKGFNLFG